LSENDTRYKHISVIEWRVSVSGALSPGINVALTGHPRCYGKDTPFSRYRPPRCKKNTEGRREEAKRMRKIGRKEERGRVKDGTRQSGKIESAGWGRYVVCSGQYLSLLHRGLVVPLRNLCLLYGQENKEASY